MPLSTSPGWFDAIGAAARSFFRRDAAPLLAPPHLDSLGASQAVANPLDGGGLVNALSGLGSVNDKGASARPNLARRPLSDDELDVLYRYVCRRLIEMVPDSATRKGWLVEDGSGGQPFGEVAVLSDLPSAFWRADVLARVHGASAIWPVWEEMGGGDWSEPLDPRRIIGLRSLVVLEKRELSPAARGFVSDPGDPQFRESSHYHIHPLTGGGHFISGKPVHHSRLLLFHGAWLPPRERLRNAGWHDSIIQSWWDALRNDHSIGQAGAFTAQELSLFVMKLKNLAAQGGGDSGGYLSRLKLLNVMKSLANGLVLFEGEEASKLATPTAGFKDLSDDAQKRLALVTGYPLAVLYGEAPSGLNTDGESHRSLWAQTIAAVQRTRYQPPLRRLYEGLYWATTPSGPPEEWSISFLPIDEMTPVQQAELERTHAETDSTRIADGVIHPDEARARFAPSGYLNNLSIDPDREAPEPPAPSAPTVPGAPGGSVPPSAVGEDDTESGTLSVPGSEKADSGGMRVPTEARRAAQGARLRRGLDRESRAAANRLTSGRVLTQDEARELQAWFTAHRGRAADELAVQARGGPTMQAALARFCRKQDALNAPMLPLIVLAPLSEAAQEIVEAARASVLQVLPGLAAPEYEPHLTLLHLGDVRAARVRDVGEAVGRALEGQAPLQLQGGQVSWFEPSQSSEGRTPIVIEYRRRALSDLNARLLRACAVDIASEQFDEYRPHITLGYLPRALTDAEAAALEDLRVSGRWSLERLELRSREQRIGSPFNLRAGL